MMFVEFPGEGVWLIGRISENLMARNLLLGTAESCTGGLAAVLCTNIPGSSRWFRGSIVAYENELKTSLLNVDSSLIAEHGAVSGPVAEAMAKGALETLGVQVALAITGIAGPDGGTPDKAVGTVWIATAVQVPEKAQSPYVASFCRHFPGDRSDVRFGAALASFGAIDAALSAVGMAEPV